MNIARICSTGTKRLAILNAIAFFLGCTAGRPGVVRMKIDERIAHIEFESDRVKVGDTIALIETRCPSGILARKKIRPGLPKCKRQVLALGKITERLNDRYSVAEFPRGVNFDEGDAVDVYQP